TLAHVLISRCVALWHPSTLDERLDHGAELAGLVESIGDPHLAYFTNWYRYAALLECGDLEHADAVLERCAELAGSLGPTMPVWIQTFTRAGRAALAGDHALAEQLAGEQLDVGTRGGQPDAALFAGVLLYVVRLQQGRLGEIADLVEQAVEGP